MPQSTRLRRYLEDELGECCEEDVDQRLAELEAFDLGDDDRVETDLGALSALANDTRYRLGRALHAADGELCVCELVPLVDVSESAVSHALSTLAEAGVVTKRKDGRWRMYRITPRGTALLVALDGTVSR
ncbi:ArsR/SmtB family transcription factor [Halomarina rubra]|uniref:ArsR/SmtB family transcription factor n=1 Tax=Halomarina rubra TaxID=2071873 RepID=A0ABD6ART7_9EURY